MDSKEVKDIKKLALGALVVGAFTVPVFRSGGRTGLTFVGWLINHTVFGPPIQFVPEESYRRELEGVEIPKQLPSPSQLEGARAYYQISEPSARELLSHQGGELMAYTSISIAAPSSAEEGKKVSVSVVIKNVSLYGVRFRAEISAVPDHYPEFLIGTIEKFLEPKESMTRSASFTMPDCNTTISVWVWSWEFNYVTHVYAWMYAGSGSKVVSLEIPAPTTFHLDIFVPSWAAGGYVQPGSGDYAAYGVLILRAYPLSGYQFVSWGGDASGTALTYNLYMNSDKNVEAYFEKVPVPEFAGSIIRKEMKYDETRAIIPVY